MSKLDVDRLAALASGDLAPEEALAAEAEAERSAEASSALAVMRTVIAALRTDDSTEPTATSLQRAKAVFARMRAGQAQRSWLDGIVESIAKLVHDTRAQPALAGFRGAADGYQLTFEANELEIDLQIEQSSGSADDGALCQVIGQVSTPTGPGAKSIAFTAPGTRESLAEIATDSRGVFSIALPRGRYDLLVEGSGGVVVVSGLDVP